MQRIQYFTPKTIDEIFVCLSQSDGKARIVADGTNFITMYSAKPKLRTDLIDVSEVQELKEITEESNYIIIGTAITKEDIMEDPKININIKEIFNSEDELLYELAKRSAEYEVYISPYNSTWKPILSLYHEEERDDKQIKELFTRIRIQLNV